MFANILVFYCVTRLVVEGAGSAQRIRDRHEQLHGDRLTSEDQQLLKKKNEIQRHALEQMRQCEANEIRMIKDRLQGIQAYITQKRPFKANQANLR
ncbi:hypothetical protein KIN20_006179 [Parelaphostrongylus tenuis]|uniref:Uncharacterized protein n=1 Tax=Parelaphostrongylus tenuis TaxID=148309 RepID=A0AAD5QGI9_PARTN|nr:hypothetical protein KIN20_006179 [Parelaphostrongylus tenuis]